MAWSPIAFDFSRQTIIYYSLRIECRLATMPCPRDTTKPGLWTLDWTREDHCQLNVAVEAARQSWFDHKVVEIAVSYSFYGLQFTIGGWYKKVCRPVHRLKLNLAS